jgi:transcriptional accessory protein Tex/SPT6
VPFIWTYRRDYLHVQMTRKHLWMIFGWDEKWDKLYSMKKR